ncbi:MAG: Na/Pi cotransporter family protein, partial [Rhodospirillales bacterium]|nr:Na/Pi cotransporter family protein [Rhodospirillales bacterium]
FLTRLVGTIVALIALDPIAARLVVWVPDTARAVADFHTGFNLVLALVFLPLLGPFSALLRRLLPAPLAPADPARPRYLDAGLRDKPAAALAAAGREALRMADRLEGMLGQAADAIASGNWRRVGEIRREDDILDRLNHAIRDFLATLDTTTMEAADRTRLGQMLSFIENIESAGDVIDRNLMARYGRLVKRGQSPGPAEREESARWLHRLATTTRAAAGVFMTGDARAARDLAGEKEAFREAEAAVEAAALTRLQRRSGSAAASAEEGVGLLDPDLLRDLKRINGHLVAAAAYPVLSGQGALLPTRLRVADDLDAER